MLTISFFVTLLSLLKSTWAVSDLSKSNWSTSNLKPSKSAFWENSDVSIPAASFKPDFGI